MKTNITNIHGMYVVKTGRVFVYVDEYENYSYSDEIIDVCTGEHYGFNGLIHLIGNPDDVFDEEPKRLKRSKRSNSNNKNRHRCARKIDDELPF